MAIKYCILCLACYLFCTERFSVPRDHLQTLENNNLLFSNVFLLDIKKSKKSNTFCLLRISRRCTPENDGTVFELNKIKREKLKSLGTINNSCVPACVRACVYKSVRLISIYELCYVNTTAWKINKKCKQTWLMGAVAASQHPHNRSAGQAREGGGHSTPGALYSSHWGFVCDWRRASWWTWSSEVVGESVCFGDRQKQTGGNPPCWLDAVPLVGSGVPLTGAGAAVNLTVLPVERIDS